jgi:very-short-patch-repair endonuclease
LGNLTQISRSLRKRPTEAEKLLWRYLSGKQFQGLKFRRQQPIGNYIVDFVCFSRRLIVELDGGQHSVEKERDILRDEWLRSQGFKVLGFWNNEILGNLEGVSEVILKEL